MKRILLLCFIHGFKGDDDTFGSFPKHFQDIVTNNLPEHEVASVVYPKYETKGELAQSTAAFLEWLKERVMDLRKAHLDNPWPPNDRSVGVILVAHSMGGFVASDCLFRILDERRQDENASGPIFPLIQGVLAFDTPYNGLARSMFVYGAFSNYQKVSNVFNVMTAISAAAPATLSRLASRRAVKVATGRIAKRSSSPAWKAWQLIAMRTGTVGVIAAGGVAAYMHRKQIIEGMRTVRSLTKEDVVAGYQQSVDALGQGLAYINRGNIGESFAYLSDHFTFVGSLLKQNELNRRLERLASLKGVGFSDVFASLGENGYWSGGYFVPERTFCAVPAKDHPAEHLFTRHVIEGTKDEIVAHINLFKPDKNKEYEKMTNDAAQRVISWFNEETEIWDDPKFAEPIPAESEETQEIAKAVDEEGIAKPTEETIEKVAGEGDQEMADDDIPEECPIDIAAAASLVPLPDDIGDNDNEGGEKSEASEQKKAYLRHLFGVAQETSTSLRSYLPSKLPSVEMPKMSMPSMPSVSMPSMPSMPSMSMPTRINLFPSKKPSDIGSTTASQASKESSMPTGVDQAKNDDSESAAENAGQQPGAGPVTGGDEITVSK
ncbi:hypothetical protein QBC40DRAFT_96688 [Triangularia verruculosa]|uniref:DUF676 domain-containing protein n=1 Tax=Triangularia verruculosa TaxID=2587418 RepID=A0AAN7AUK4_9PEZI|nr:hypothetical protein QBC40DRAFT_96688 [Triangularia verruculosa]